MYLVYVKVWDLVIQFGHGMAWRGVGVFLKYFCGRHGILFTIAQSYRQDLC